MAFKICVIGCGNISETQHGPSIKRYEQLHEGVLFAACCDVDEKRARGYKETFGLPRHYTDIDNMLSAEKPDAVSLICPEEKTAKLSGHIMEKGFPLLVEKPPGMNGDETRHMIEVARKRNIPNQVAFNRRYIPLVQKLMDIIDNMGGAKTITDIYYRMLRVNRKDDNFATTAIHGIDLVRYIAGTDYQKLDIHYHNLPQWGDNVANIHLNGLMVSDAVVHMDFFPMSGAVTERLEVNTHGGLFWLELPVWSQGYDMPGKITQMVNNVSVFSITGEEAVDSADEFMLNGFYHENERFFDDVRNKKLPKGDIASGLQSVEIADCIYKREQSYSKK